jgi:hypothetical protein
MAAILVIGVVAAELVIAGLAVALDGAVIFLMDLKAQMVASARPCRLLGGGEQRRSDAAAGMFARNSTMAVPTVAPSASATNTTADAEARIRRRLRRDIRSVSNTRFSSSHSASRSAGRLRRMCTTYDDFAGWGLRISADYLPRFWCHASADEPPVH